MSLHSSLDHTQKAVPLLDDMDESLFDHEKEISRESLNKDNSMMSPVQSLGNCISLTPDSESLDDSDETSEESSVKDSWISWFCNSRGHNYFLEIPEEYVEDDFNLTGLSNIVPYYTEALYIILDLEPDQPTSHPASFYEPSAHLLYGLIHQRYITSRGGLASMAERYESQDFGLCPRVGCGGGAVVPCGRSCNPGEESMKLYCPRCDDVYHPRESKYQAIDGCFFGPTFPHLLFMTYSELIPPLKIDQSVDDEEMHGDLDNYTIFEPKIFGFRLSKLSPVGPRMQWLRYRSGYSASRQ